MKKALFILLISVLACSVAIAQPKLFGQIGGGAMFLKGATTRAAGFAGFNVPVKTDVVLGYRNYVHTAYYYTHGDDSTEAQAFAVFDITQKYITWSSFEWYVALGFGYIQEIREGADARNGAVKLETGCSIYKGFGFKIGADYLPVGGRDKIFGYLGVDLFPF